MATSTTRVSDVIIPEVYETYTAVNSPEKTAFFESGIVVRNALLDAAAGNGGETINLPFWKDLDSSVEENLSSSDPAVVAEAEKILTGKQIARKANVNKWYSNADLASQLAGADANQQVRNRFGTYWMRRFQKRVIAITNGILADNVAHDSSDMVHDVAVESIAAQTTATKWSRSNFTSAIFTMGDAADMLSAMVVHSSIYKQMVDADDIDFIPDSQGSLTIPTFMGIRVIKDDGMTVVAGTTDGFKYVTVIFGAGAIGYGEATPDAPFEIDRESRQGNGGGVDYLGERKLYMVHAFGFQTVGTPAAEGGFSHAELALATTHDRVIDRKSIPIAYLISN